MKALTQDPLAAFATIKTILDGFCDAHDLLPFKSRRDDDDVIIRFERGDNRVDVLLTAKSIEKFGLSYTLNRLIKQAHEEIEKWKT